MCDDIQSSHTEIKNINIIIPPEEEHQVVLISRDTNAHMKLLFSCTPVHVLSDIFYIRPHVTFT